MSFKSTLFAVAAAITLTSAAQAGDDAATIVIMDPYVRSSTQSSATGAAFMTLMNNTDLDDRLIAASSDSAERVELHTHIEDANGVMQMREIEGGIALAAGSSHALKRGGDHVMFLGLKHSLSDGDTVSITLTFEQAGDIIVEVPVDLTRTPDHGGMKHKSGTDG